MSLPILPERGDPVSASEVERIEREHAENVVKVKDFSMLREWLARAAALESYLRSRGLQDPMLGAQRRTEARIGQLLREPEKGGRGKRSEHDPRLRDYLPEFRLLGRALAGECEVAPVEWRETRRALVTKVRRRLGEEPKTPPLPADTFRCLVADPPWQLTTGATMPGKFGEIAIKQGGDSLTYSQMSVEDIKGLPIEERAAPDSHLYLWTVNRYVEDAYDVAREWGFEPSALLTWCKTQMGVGLGGTFRQTSEFILFARRGKLKASQIVERTWWEWPRGKHSVKPDAFYELVESVTPAPRLDLFARRERPGWVSWGAGVQSAA